MLINLFTAYDAPWLSLIIGLLTGLCVGRIAPGAGKLNYFCGAIAALVTLAAVILGEFATASISSARAVRLATPPGSARSQPSVEEDKVTSERPAALEIYVPDTPKPQSAPIISRSPRPVSQFDATHVTSVSLAAVVAYILGCSGKPRPTTQRVVETSEQDDDAVEAAPQNN